MNYKRSLWHGIFAPKGTPPAILDKLPVKTLAEFVDFARKANPHLFYASIGNGSHHHLAMEMLKQRAGIDLTHVPYKGGGPASIAVISGENALMFGGTSVVGHIKNGKLKALAVSGSSRGRIRR